PRAVGRSIIRGPFMPPPSSPPSGKPRRRPGPVMPGGWIWVVILGLLIAIFMFTSFASTPVTCDEFVKLVYDSEYSENLSQVVFVDSEPIVGELKNAENVPEEMKAKLHGSQKFMTLRPPGEDKQLTDRLTELATKHGVKIIREKDHFGW